MNANVRYTALGLALALASACEAPQDAALDKTTQAVMVERGRIAYWYGKVNVHRDVGGAWARDNDCSSGANLDPLTYCKKFYPITTQAREVALTAKTGNIWWTGSCGAAYASNGEHEYVCESDDGTLAGGVPPIFMPLQGQNEQATALYAPIPGLADFHTHMFAEKTFGEAWLWGNALSAPMDCDGNQPQLDAFLNKWIKKSYRGEVSTILTATEAEDRKSAWDDLQGDILDGKKVKKKLSKILRKATDGLKNEYTRCLRKMFNRNWSWQDCLTAGRQSDLKHAAEDMSKGSHGVLKIPALFWTVIMGTDDLGFHPAKALVGSRTSDGIAHTGNSAQAMLQGFMQRPFMYWLMNKAYYPGTQTLQPAYTGCQSSWPLITRGCLFITFYNNRATILPQMYAEGAAGVNLVIASATNFRPLCALMRRENYKNLLGWGPTLADCDDMRAVEKNLAQARAFDAQYDWAEIATSSDQARQIINRGNLAIILSAEVSDYLPSSRGSVASQLDALRASGLSTSQIAQEVDSELVGVAPVDKSFPLVQWFRNRINFDQIVFDSTQMLDLIHGVLTAARPYLPQCLAALDNIPNDIHPCPDRNLLGDAIGCKNPCGDTCYNNGSDSWQCKSCLNDKKCPNPAVYENGVLVAGDPNNTWPNTSRQWHKCKDCAFCGEYKMAAAMRTCMNEVKNKNGFDCGVYPAGTMINGQNVGGQPAHCMADMTNVSFKNQVGLKPNGNSAVLYMASHGMPIDMEHMSEKAVVDTVNQLSAGGYCKFPVYLSHVHVRENIVDSFYNGKENVGFRTEKSTPRYILDMVSQSGGVVGMRTETRLPFKQVLGQRVAYTPRDLIRSVAIPDPQPGGPTVKPEWVGTSWGFAQQVEVAHQARVNIGFGSDYHGMVRQLSARCAGLSGDAACRATGLGSEVDRNGLVHWGLLPTLWLDLVAMDEKLFIDPVTGSTGKARPATVNMAWSTEAYLRMWKRAELMANAPRWQASGYTCGEIDELIFARNGVQTLDTVSPVIWRGNRVPVPVGVDPMRTVAASAITSGNLFDTTQTLRWRHLGVSLAATVPFLAAIDNEFFQYTTFQQVTELPADLGPVTAFAWTSSGGWQVQQGDDVPPPTPTPEPGAQDNFAPSSCEQCVRASCTYWSDLCKDDDNCADCLENGTCASPYYYQQYQSCYQSACAGLCTQEAADDNDPNYTYPADNEAGRIAYWYGKVNVHRATGDVWRNDSDCSSGASIDPLTYCRKFWPNTVQASAITPTAKSGNIWYTGGCGSAYPSNGQNEYACIVAEAATSATYSVSNTSSATQNFATASIFLQAGQMLDVGTCGVAGSSFTGDTYLRLNLNGGEVAANDDSCGGLGSRISYTASSTGTYTVQLGCYSSSSCSGTATWTISWP